MTSFEYYTLGPCKRCGQYTAGVSENNGIYAIYCDPWRCGYSTSHHNTLDKAINEWEHKTIVPVYCKSCKHKGDANYCPWPNNPDNGYCNRGELNYRTCEYRARRCTAPDTECPHWQGTFCEMEASR